MSHDTEYESTSSGASLTYPMQCSSIKKGGYVVLNGRPCKVMETSTSKTGKHGHAKVHLVGIDIFTGKKYEENCPSTHNLDVPHVERVDYNVIAIDDDGFVSLLASDGSTKDDLKVPEGEVGEALKAKWAAAEASKSDDSIVVSVLKAMGEEAIIAVKEVTK